MEWREQGMEGGGSGVVGVDWEGRARACDAVAGRAGGGTVGCRVVSATCRRVPGHKYTCARRRHCRKAEGPTPQATHRVVVRHDVQPIRLRGNHRHVHFELQLPRRLRRERHERGRWQRVAQCLHEQREVVRVVRAAAARVVHDADVGARDLDVRLARGGARSLPIERYSVRSRRAQQRRRGRRKCCAARRRRGQRTEVARRKVPSADGDEQAQAGVGRLETDDCLQERHIRRLDGHESVSSRVSA